MKVINLYAGPGAGKSTTAAGLFYRMKQHGLSVELATEYAKDKVYEGHLGCLEDQIYIFGKQQRRIGRLRGHVDWCVTDSPLLISILYSQVNSSNFNQLVLDIYNEYENYNFYIDRTKPYVKKRRHQDEDQAKELDVKMESILLDYDIPYTKVKGDEHCVDSILKKLFNEKP